MLEADDATPIRHYLLIVTRKRRPRIQLLWAEDLHEARDMAKELTLLDYAVTDVRTFRQVRNYGGVR